MKNRNITFTTILFALGCFALCPRMQAVVPAPDGGYPGGNTAEGQDALFSLTTGMFNTAVGFFSGHAFTAGNLNTAIGAGALLLTTAEENTATGAGALLNSSGGFANTANGAFALFSDTDGDFNTAVGDGALFHNTTGGGNTALGVNAGDAVTTANNVICIGGDVHGANVDDSCFIGNIFQKQVGNDSLPVLVDSFGKLGTGVSSRRFKHNIKPMDKASEAVLALKPVTFHYKSDTKDTPQYGLIAEEVAEISSDLVVRDKNGQIYTVRYEAVNAMLLNEFLKEHKKVHELEATVAQQQKNFQSALAQQQKRFQSKLAEQERQIDALTSGLRKVNAHLVTASPSRDRPAPRLAVSED